MIACRGGACHSQRPVQLWGGISWVGLLVQSRMCSGWHPPVILLASDHCVCPFGMCVCVLCSRSCQCGCTPWPCWISPPAPPGVLPLLRPPSLDSQHRRQDRRWGAPVAYIMPYKVCVVGLIVSTMPPPILPGKHGYFAMCASPLLLLPL